MGVPSEHVTWGLLTVTWDLRHGDRSADTSRVDGTPMFGLDRFLGGSDLVGYGHLVNV